MKKYNGESLPTKIPHLISFKNSDNPYSRIYDNLILKKYFECIDTPYYL